MSGPTLTRVMKSSRIPTRRFFQDPLRDKFRISPGGQIISFLQKSGKHWQIFMQVGPCGAAKLLTTKDGGDVTDYFWKNDGCLIYKQRGRHYRLDVTDGKTIELSAGKDVSFDVIPALKGVPDEEILIEVSRSKSDLTDVYRLNISSTHEDPTIAAKHPDPRQFGVVQRWVVNNSGDVCAALAVKGLTDCLLTRAGANQSFKIAKTMDFRQSISDFSLIYGNDSGSIYAISRMDPKRDTNVVTRVSTTTGQEIDCVYHNPKVDVEGFGVGNNGKVAYVSFNDPDIPTQLQYAVIDPRFSPVFQTLNEKLRGYVFWIDASDKAQTKFIVRVRSDRQPGKYYLLDASNRRKHQLFFLGYIAPWLKEKALAPVLPVKIAASDGLTIHGYLTLPLGRKPKNLPAVLNVHGGPENRNYWDCDPIYGAEVQFFANRGYAVLQLNFRGSIGYGRAFWEKGFRQHGRDMQRDLTNGFQWLIDQGIADPKRIAIYGRSYGGYASLAGVTFTAQMYQAAISYDGVSNWLTWLRDCVPPTDPFFEQFCIKVGDPTKDRAYLEAVAPALHAHNIKKPIFIAHGAQDDLVPKSESDQMVAAIRRADTDYMVKANEGHTFQRQENRLEFYGAVERFLAKHLRNVNRAQTKPNRV